MSVDTTISDAPTALASDDHAAPALRSRRKAQTAPPRSLTLVCERCERVIRGSGAGFAYVDLRDAQAVSAGRLDGGKARWWVTHKACTPEAVATINPYFRIWAERIGTVDELLDAVAELSRLGWFAHTDWGGLVRRLLADTDAEQSRRPRNSARVVLAPDDPRHGTENGYRYCRCLRCTDANTTATRERNARRKARLSGSRSDEPGSGG